MFKTTQKELREYVRMGLAKDYTHASTNEVKELGRKCLNRLGYSTGVYGLNGLLFEDYETGEKYVVIGRGTNLYSIC